MDNMNTSWITWKFTLRTFQTSLSSPVRSEKEPKASHSFDLRSLYWLLEPSHNYHIMAAASPLGSFSENATRLGMRIQETLTERITRDFGSSTTALFDTEDKTTDIRKRLDSTNDKEKIDALRRLIAMISKGRNVSEFFAQVVKNVASHNLEVRKLVYIYILRYAESEPDLALLSVNTFQRDLTDSNPLIRSMALRVLSGIRVAVIGSIVTLAIKKCSAD
ncbi:AP-3 complex subunit beta, partial [Serendipita sp. 407]